MTSPSALNRGTIYHIFNRGVNRENIFHEERNYAHFMALYQKHIEPVAETFAYCLLRNHFHLLVRIRTETQTLTDTQTLRETQTLRVLKTLRVSEKRDSNVSTHFSNFFNAYAKAINKAYGRTGSLFQHPFGRVAVTNTIQFYRVVLYIHQNPQKHQFVDDFREWKYSSYGVLLGDEPTRLERETVQGWFGGSSRFRELHDEWITDRESVQFADEDVD